MHASNPLQSPAGADSTPPSPPQSRQKLLALVVFAITFGAMLYFSRNWLSLEVFAQQETKLRALLQSNPVLVLGGAFLIYVLVAGLSIPGARQGYHLCMLGSSNFGWLWF